ncbi:MAG: hypothetical protein IJF65_09125 [Clostridia bacterium]|nr:hypothetical protein [Clostridia bacterium]
MNSNRNRYASAPTYGMQKRTAPKKNAVKKAPAPNTQQPQSGAYPNQPPYPPQGMAPQQGMVPQPPMYPGMMPPPGVNPYGYQQPPAPSYPTPSAGGNQMNQQMGGYPPVNPGMQPMYPPQGGYATQQPPQPQPPKKQPAGKSRQKDTWLQILLLAILPILFIAAMITKQPPLFWVFIGFALVGLIAMWLQSTFVSSARTTLSLIYGALLIVSAVTILTSGGPARDTTGTPANAALPVPPAQNAVVQQPQAVTNTSSGPSGMTLEDLNYQSNPYLVEYTPEPSVTSEASAQLDSFMYMWNANKLDEMVSLCAPSWSTGLDDARKSLYAILANRLPMDYTMERITGTDADSSRTITMTVTIDKQNNRAPSKYRFQVLMLKENGVWYVDPQSLKSNEPAETPTPAPEATDAPVPTAPPSNKLKLYYNTDGGTFYHAQEHCSTISEEYYSKMKSFYYGDLNNSKFKSLKPCKKCGAPTRP